MGSVCLRGADKGKRESKPSPFLVGKLMDNAWKCFCILFWKDLSLLKKTYLLLGLLFPSMILMIWLYIFKSLKHLGFIEVMIPLKFSWRQVVVPISYIKFSIFAPILNFYPYYFPMCICILFPCFLYWYSNMSNYVSSQLCEIRYSCLFLHMNIVISLLNNFWKGFCF